MSLLAHVTPQEFPLWTTFLLVGIFIGVALSYVIVGLFNRGN